MSIFSPKSPLQICEAAAETIEQLIEQKQTRLTLRLEWVRQLRISQESQELRARWQVK
jgi:hypothetical protein